jgi:OPA family sugar phosphate sensor protein UhpC-like MFS transporter
MFSVLSFFATGPAKEPLRDPQQIDRLYKRARISSVAAVTLGYGCAYTCRLSFAVAKKPLADAGLFGADQLGLIGSVFFYTYAVAKLTNGFLADHANLKRFFSLGILASALINLLMGSWHSLAVWMVLWGMNGWFQGFGAPTGAVVLSRWFGNRERGQYYGIFSTCHSIGEGLTFIALPVAVSMYGWRAGFGAPAAVCLVVGVAAYLAMHDRPQAYGLPPVAVWRKEEAPGPSAEQAVRGAARAPSTWQSQLSIFRLRSIWTLGLASACLYVTRYAINSWGLFYLQEEKGFTLVQAGSMLWINTMAGIVGSVSFGFVSDRLFKARRPPVNLIYGLLQIGALSLILFGPRGHTALLVAALVVYGFAISGLLASLGGLFAIDIAPRQAAGAAMGFVGIFSYLGAALQEMASGYMIEHASRLVGGVRHYDFSGVVLVWFGASLVSLLLALSLWRATTSR